jgi:beta-glucosidase
LAVAAVAVTSVVAMTAGVLAAATPPASAAKNAETGFPWMNPRQNPTKRAEELLAAMTLSQKLQMIDGAATAAGDVKDYAGYIPGIPSLDIPPLYLSDGAVGVGNGSTGVTQFPSGLNDAATWNPAMVRKVGAADGAEQAAKGHNVSLAPNLNIARTPYGGRVFEGYGEDPYLSSMIAAADVKGVQSSGVIATPKHYIGNDQETLRNSINAEISQRALAEIYDPAFQASIDAGAGAVMCSYNQINGYYACQNAQTLTDTLRDALQFKGFVMSDWGATHSTVASANAGLDVDMPGGNPTTDYYGDPMLAAVEDGQVSVSTINTMVEQILWAMFSVGLFDHTYPDPTSVANADVSTPADNQVALKASEEGTVLLKNAGNVLPINQNKVRSIAIIGDPAGTDAMYGGGGSATVIPTNPVTPIAGITARAAAAGITVNTAQGDSDYRALAQIPADEFTPTSGTGTGWTATYYPTANFTGTPLGTENVTSLDVTSVPAIVGSATTWSVKYTATMTSPTTATDEFAVSAVGPATLTVGGQTIVSSIPGTNSTFSGLASLQANTPTTFELDVVGGTPSGRTPSVADATWAPSENLLWAAAQQAAAKSDVAVVFASNYSAEGSDLATLELPGDQDQLIEAVAQVNPHVIVVLNTSSAVYMPWLNDVQGVFEAWYPGQQYGNSIAALLFGDVDPSGHLPLTFPVNAQQGVADGATLANPSLTFPGNGTDVVYSEGIDVGYRYYDVHNETPLFPFGYGLSYTTFSYSHLRVRAGNRADRRATVTVTVTNTGNRAGADVVQLYLTDPAAATEPPYQLKGFHRVSLAPGESKRVTFIISQQDMSYYNTSTSSWVAVPGSYGVTIGSNERDHALTGSWYYHRNRKVVKLAGVNIAVMLVRVAAGAAGPEVTVSD